MLLKFESLCVLRNAKYTFRAFWILRLSRKQFKNHKNFRLAHHLETIDQLEIATSNLMPAKITLIGPLTKKSMVLFYWINYPFEIIRGDFLSILSPLYHWSFPNKFEWSTSLNDGGLPCSQFPAAHRNGWHRLPKSALGHEVLSQCQPTFRHFSLSRAQRYR